MAISTNGTIITRVAGALYGEYLSNASYLEVSTTAPATVAANFLANDFAGKTDLQVATTILTNLGLTSIAGLDNYVAGQLTAAGSSAASKGAALVNMLNGYAGMTADATYGTYATSFNAKVAASLAASQTDGAVGGAFATATAKAQNFVLTKSSVSGVMDAATGTEANDTFNGLSDGMLETGDDLNGGAGTDTVNGRFTANGQTVAPTLTGIEEVYVQVDGANAKTFTFDATGVTGTIWNKNHDDDGNDDDTDETVTFTNVANTTAAGIYGGQEYSDTTVTFKTTTSTADSGTIKFAGAKADTVTVASIEILNLDVSKVVTPATTTGSTTIDTLAATSAKSINVTGNASLKLSATDTATTLTVDASKMSTGGSFNFASESGSALTFIGSNGNDRVNIGAIAQLTSVDTINGGAGTDTFATSDTGSAFTSDERTLMATRLSGFERLEFTGTAATSVDFTDLAIFDTVTYTGATTGVAGTGASAEGAGNAGADAHTITGIDTGDAIIVSAAIVGGAGEALTDVTAAVDGGNGANAFSLSTELDNGSNSFTITFSANITGGAGGAQTGTVGATAGSGGDGGHAIYAPEFETITLITANNSSGTLLGNAAQAAGLAIAGGAGGDDGVSGTAENGTAGNSVVIGTNGKIVVQGAIDLNLGTIAGTNATVDAKDYTGELIVTLEAGANTFIGGSGNDVVTGQKGLDTYTLGAGIDRVIIGIDTTTTSSDAPASGTSFESITDFVIGQDLLDFLAADDSALSETIVTNTTAIVGTAAINAEGIASFNAADDTLAERITAVEAAIQTGTATAGQMAIFEFSGSTYVFVSNGSDTVEAGDVVIKLTGVTGVSSTTIDDNGYLTLG